MRYAVGVELKEDGQTVAHVLDLPGCFSRGDTPHVALDRLFVAIPAYWDWLRAHGVAAPPPDLVGPVTLAVVELIRGSAPQDASERGALFEVELEPATETQINACLTRLGYARADLLSLLEPLPPDEWAASRADGRTLAERIADLAEAERWYTRRLGPVPRLRPTHGPLDRLAAVRAAAQARLSSLSAEECATVYILDGERWTARKVLRRMLEHECEQVAQIALLLDRVGPDLPPGG
jgi:predicted RNase H-like HicB family nuclease